MRFETWAKDGMTYQDYTKVAFGLEERFMESEKRISDDLRAGRCEGSKRHGGADHRLFY